MAKDQVSNSNSAVKPNLNSVRDLVQDVGALAKHLGMSYNAIYRWLKVERIPGAHVIKVANFYDVEVRDLLHLTGSEKNNEPTYILKKRDTLKHMMDVYRGLKTMEEGCKAAEIPLISGRLILTHWGDELPTLYTTLEQLAEKRISLDMAADRLKITKYTLHTIRRKYGYAPGKLKARPKPPGEVKPRIPQWVKDEARDHVIAGRLMATEAAKAYGIGYRTVLRAVEEAGHKVQAIASWPRCLRRALVAEREMPFSGTAARWYAMVSAEDLPLPSSFTYPRTPDRWAGETLRRMLIGVLLDEVSLAEVAAARGGDPGIIATMFDSELRPFGVTFDDLRALPVAHQTAVGEILVARMLQTRRMKVEGLMTPDEIERRRAVEKAAVEKLEQEIDMSQVELQAARDAEYARLERLNKEKWESRRGAGAEAVAQKRSARGKSKGKGEV